MKRISAILTCALMGFTLVVCSSKNRISEGVLDAYVKAAASITKMKSATYDTKLPIDAGDMGTAPCTHLRAHETPNQ